MFSQETDLSCPGSVFCFVRPFAAAPVPCFRQFATIRFQAGESYQMQRVPLAAIADASDRLEPSRRTSCAWPADLCLMRSTVADPLVPFKSASTGWQHLSTAHALGITIPFVASIKVPVIFITAHVAVREMGVASGAACLLKPFNDTILIEAVKMALGDTSSP